MKTIFSAIGTALGENETWSACISSHCPTLNGLTNKELGVNKFEPWICQRNNLIFQSKIISEKRVESRVRIWDEAVL